MSHRKISYYFHVNRIDFQRILCIPLYHKLDQKTIPRGEQRPFISNVAIFTEVI